MREWQFDIRVLDSNPLYHNQIFRLKIVFGDSYPIGRPLRTVGENRRTNKFLSQSHLRPHLN